MTAVTIQTAERLGEKCNFPSSVELQKKKRGGGLKKEPSRIICLQLLELVVITIMMSPNGGTASAAITQELIRNKTFQGAHKAAPVISLEHAK